MAGAVIAASPLGLQWHKSWSFALRRSDSITYSCVLNARAGRRRTGSQCPPLRPTVEIGILRRRVASEKLIFAMVVEARWSVIYYLNYGKVIPGFAD
jgi:hypothetical protein